MGVTLLIGVNNQYRGRSADQYGTQFVGLLQRAIGFAGGDAKRVSLIRGQSKQPASVLPCGDGMIKQGLVATEATGFAVPGWLFATNAIARLPWSALLVFLALCAADGAGVQWRSAAGIERRYGIPARQFRRGVEILILLGAIWSSSFMWIKIAIQEIGPVTLVAFRVLFGLLFGVIVIYIQGIQWPRTRKDWLPLFVLGVANIAIPFFLISWGELSIDSAVASILNATVPLFTILIAHYLLRDDKMTVPKVLGLLLGFAGVVILMSKDIGASLGSVLGQLAVVLASAFYAGGVKLDDLRRQWDDIDELQDQVKIKILRGTESDILADGRLDYPDDILEQFDVIVASIHSRYKMNAEKMTERVITAMRQPVFKIWGHALGRLIVKHKSAGYRTPSTPPRRKPTRSIRRGSGGTTPSISVICCC